MSSPSPICTVDGYSTIDGVDVSAGSTVTIQLSDLAGVSSWSIKVIDSDDLQSPASINSGLAVNNITRTCTFTAPSTARGCALIFQSRVNNGKDLNGKNQSSYTTTFGVFVVGSSGLRLLARNQTTQGDADYGWITDVNAILARGGTTPAATDTVSGTIKMTGDLDGDSTSPVVVGLQGNSVSDEIPDDGYVLTWNDALSQWEPQDAPSSGSADATTTTNGVVRLAGDLGGSGTAAATPRVGSINGASVPAAGSLTTHHVLRVTGSSALGYGLITNNNVSASAAIAGSKVSPNFGSQAATCGNLTADGKDINLGEPNGVITIQGSLELDTIIVDSNYTVDASSTKDCVILCNISSTFTVTLPTPTAGRTLIIKDVSGNANSFNVDVDPDGNQIDGSSSNLVLNSSYGVFRLISDGSNWFTI